MSVRRPRIKPEHGPYLTREGTVRLGSGVFGIATEVEDSEGWLWTLICATDGTRTPAEITSRVRKYHHDKDLSDGDVQAALDQLIEEGYVEDAGAPSPTDLTPREQERYGRSLQYYRWTDLTPRDSPWDIQRMLKKSRVALVGLGGAGGAAALSLTASGIGHLHCIDSDIVELSNLNRQTLFSEDDLGSPKVKSALKRLRRLNTDIEITGEQLWLSSQCDFAKSIAGFDLLVLCADRPDNVRLWANRACLAEGIPWVDGGYHGPLITVGAYTPGVGACWECIRRAETSRWQAPVTSSDDLVKAFPRAPGHPVAPFSAALSGQLVAYLTVALLTKASYVTPGSIFGLNLMVPGDNVFVEHPRNTDCPSCSANR